MFLLVFVTVFMNDWHLQCIFGIFAIDRSFFDIFWCFFVRQQDDIYIMLEWKQVSIHLKGLLSSEWLVGYIWTWKVRLPLFGLHQNIMSSYYQWYFFCIFLSSKITRQSSVFGSIISFVCKRSRCRTVHRRRSPLHQIRQEAIRESLLPVRWTFRWTAAPCRL